LNHNLPDLCLWAARITVMRQHHLAIIGYFWNKYKIGSWGIQTKDKRKIRHNFFIVNKAHLDSLGVGKFHRFLMIVVAVLQKQVLRHSISHRNSSNTTYPDIMCWQVTALFM
jgi:hypothetical protein